MCACMRFCFKMEADILFDVLFPAIHIFLSSSIKKIEMSLTFAVFQVFSSCRFFTVYVNASRVIRQSTFCLTPLSIVG